MIIFPAIDLIDGKCVRLSAGDFERVKEYNADPLDMAMQYQDAGLTHLHLVDLDGARNKKVSQYKLLEKIAHHTSLVIDFGGGIQSEDDLTIVFECGANQANIGSLAVKDPSLFMTWLRKYGSEKLIFAADVKDKILATHAWKEGSGVHLFQLIEQFLESGLVYITSTDISKDGMLKGSNHDLYKELVDRYTHLKVTASGGVNGIEDLEKLHMLGCFGAIVGKAIYENKVSLSELQQLQTKKDLC